MKGVSKSRQTRYEAPAGFRTGSRLKGEQVALDDIASIDKKDHTCKHPKGRRVSLDLRANAEQSTSSRRRLSQGDKAEQQRASTSADRMASGLGIHGLLKMTMTVLVLLIIDRFLGIVPDPASLLKVAVTALLVKAMLLYAIPSRDFDGVPGWAKSYQAHFLMELKFAFTLTAALFFLGIAGRPLPLALFLAVNSGLQFLLLAAWKKLRKAALRQIRSAPCSTSESNIIIVGASEKGKQTVDLLLEQADSNLRLLGFVDFDRRGLWRYRDIPLLGHPSNLDRIIAEKQVDYVVMATEPKDFSRSQNVFSLLESMGVSICALPNIYEYRITRPAISAVGDLPIMVYRSDRRSNLELHIKEAMDRIGAFLGLVLCAPILLLSVMAIRLDSKGPAFFTQERLGKNGRRFKMYKLRTMINHAERQKDRLNHLNEMSGPVFKIKQDPRVTRVGRILRKFSIDEFPQFFNILKGDMSLVGPRPPLPREVAQYKPWQRRKLSIKPGATCLWQINGRNEIDFEGWMKLDLEYIDNWSLKKDAEILAKTLPALLKGKGAS
jgi:exopolysaccharide biosynthesis polyprenyl glycosylphosphotransferase